MVQEIRQSREVGDKLLCDVRRQTEEHREQVEVLATSLEGKQGILEFLSCEVERLRSENKNLTRTIAAKTE
jgi:hypothetical protein